MILLLILLLIAEYIGDFLLQSREMALKKSSDDGMLLAHVSIIFCCLLPLAYFYGLKVIALAGLYCVLHAVQDKFIWNGYKWLVYNRFKKKVEADKDPNNRYGEEYSHNMAIKYCEKFEKNKEYAEDKAFYDTIGLDRTLHIITMIVLWSLFFL